MVGQVVLLLARQLWMPKQQLPADLGGTGGGGTHELSQSPMLLWLPPALSGTQYAAASPDTVTTSRSQCCLMGPPPESDAGGTRPRSSIRRRPGYLRRLFIRAMTPFAARLTAPLLTALRPSRARDAASG